MHSCLELHLVHANLFLNKKLKIMKMKIGILGLFLCSVLFISMYTLPKSVIIKGVVIDQLGNKLIGASIWESGTKNGVKTDVDGSFELTISSPRTTIIVARVGYVNVELNLKEHKLNETLEIIMTSTQTVDDVEVKLKHHLKEKIDMRGDISPIYDYKGFVAEGSYLSEVANASEFAVRFYKERPMHNTESYDAINENKFLAAKDTPLSTFSIDVDAASYSNMRRFINRGQTPPKDAVRIEEMVNYFDYDYPQPKGKDPFEVITEYSDCPWNAMHKLVHVGLQGKEIPKENLPASNLVFLCDVSGSMNNANKLPLLQSSLKMLVNNLREQDKVSLVVYAGSSGLVLEPTSGNQKQEIKEAIDRLNAGGRTAGAEGIRLAYQQARKAFIEGGNNRILLATDGDFNVGVSSDAELVKLIETERESGVFLTVMGFGTGNYKDSKMEKLANKGNGNYAYIDNINEARKVLVSEFGGTLFTIAKDVKLQIEFNPTQVASYRLIGYENRLLNKEDFNNDKKDAGELGAGHTVTAMYEIIPVGVKSEFGHSVDPLKYQKNLEVQKSTYADELMTVKNYRWAATVAGFGMMLRDSEYAKDANFAGLIDMGKKAKGEDIEGYRAEMIKMMKNMQSVGVSISE